MITNTQIPSLSPTSIYTSDGNTAVLTIIFCNTSLTNSAQVDLYIVPFGENATPTSQIIKQLNIGSSETIILDTEKIVLEDGDSIFAQSSINSIVTTTVVSMDTGL